MEEKWIERDGARIAYSVSGEGPVIVLGHGLLCDRRMWDDVAPRLSERHRHRIINIDVRGHGASTAPAPFSLEDLAEDWRAILDAERVERAFLCGLSMGGMTAMRLAMSDEKRVAGMALLDSSGERETPWARVKYRAMAEAVRRFGHLDPLYQTVGKLMFGATTLHRRPHLVQREIIRWKQHDPAQLFHAVRAVIDRQNLLGRLRSLRCPTLILVGEEDLATPPYRSQRLLAAIQGSRIHRVEAAGHLSAIEQPDEVAGAILEFVNSLAW